MKIKYKIFLQFILLIALVSGAIIATTQHLSNESREEVLNEVSRTLRHLQDISSREFEDARDVASKGVIDASGLGAIDQVTEISFSNQEQFFRVVQSGIDTTGERIETTLDAQSNAVEDGLDELLAQVTEAITGLVTMDRTALEAIAGVSLENVSYLQWASQEGLKRLEASREKMTGDMKSLNRRNLDEIDILLTSILRGNYFSPEQEKKLARQFLQLKDSIAARQQELFDAIFASLDQQRRVLGGEIDIASANVQWAIEREKEYTTIDQQRRIAKVVSRLKREQGRLRYRIDQLALAMRRTVGDLKVKLPQRLKEESDTTNRAISEQIELARAGTTKAQEEVATRIAESTVKANTVFESAIDESRKVISEYFSAAQSKTAHTSLYIAFGCGFLAMGLGFIMIRNITQPISHVLSFADRMSRGDLSQRLKEGKDEMGEMGRALNRMADDLEKLQQATIDSFTDTLDKVLDCVFMFDPKTLQYSYVNQGAVDHLGYSREQLLEMTPLDIKPEFTEDQLRELANSLASGQYESKTYTTVHRDIHGADIPVEVLLRHVTPPGNEPRFVAIVRDISDRIQQAREKEKMQTELLNSQKMESVGQLAAGIAHEINTPTQFIGANIEFIADTVKDLTSFFDGLEVQKNGWPEEVRAAIEQSMEKLDWEYLAEELPGAISQSREGVERVSSIVGAMKRFSHPGTREKTLCDLQELIMTALTVSRNEWTYVAEVETDFSPDLPKVPLFSDQMGQVVLNMMINSAHAIQDKMAGTASEEKGRITITTRLLDSEVELVFEDTGSGIPENIISKVFDPFFTTKEVGKGTGQGLSISHDVITRKHGGSLEVESELGKGARFIIRLPIE